MREGTKTTPVDNILAPENMGRATPMETGDGGHIQFGPQPNTIPKTYTAPESSKQPPSKGGGAPIPPVTSVHPEASDNLLEALRGASLDEGNRTLMSMVIRKVSSAKSGLPEACTSQLTGFKVRNKYVQNYHPIGSSP